MFGEALVAGIVITLVVVAVAVAVGAVLLRRRKTSGEGNAKVVPPPADPGPTHPEQARDVHADEERRD